MMTDLEALEVARVCRQQAQLTTDQKTAALLGDLAVHYEAIACSSNPQTDNRAVEAVERS